MSGQLAKSLLEIKAVHLSPEEPFTWASGIQSPIYCDNRLTLSFPAVRKEIARLLAEEIQLRFPEVTHISGTATAGIPHAALVSEKLDLPMSYVRGEAKGHGRKNQIEGFIREGDQVVVVEDLISTGKSVIKVVEALRENGCTVLGVISIFTYGLEKGLKQLQDAGIESYSLCTYRDLIETAVEVGAVREEDLDILREWQKNPEEWKVVLK
ncbi:orotate phosphoribosyltransferase [Bacillus carboniphilus]|uniref:Orotate phosphoribosyltransferase n=1 Tax=Bacillus carboniphilus TaxID=86663 RepID=A0ABP3G007_9BACI